MKQAPDELVRIAHRIGQRIPGWTQGPGGNVSLKVPDGSLWIKASGFRLSEVRTDFGFAQLSLDQTRASLGSVNSELSYADVVRAFTPRPSMEIGFHAGLPRAWVLHFHSLGGISMAHACCQHPGDFEAWWSARTRLRYRILPFVLPGLELSQLILREASQAPETEVFLLRNHGVVLHSDQPTVLEEWAALDDDWVRTRARAKNRPSACVPRILTPDHAVFWIALQAKLTAATGGRMCWNPMFTSQHFLTEFELWEALCELERIDPNLDAISDQQAASIARLPVEQLRLETVAKAEK
jgi:ribulose-5-phosphate 4-epimerase/fuculose-1-phosphate aldolase